jgi:predicted acetyltransferase
MTGKLYGSKINTKIYMQLEDLGVLDIYGGFEDDNLAGFLITVTSEMQHYSKQFTTVESLFVAKKHRNSHLGVSLIKNIQKIAEERHSAGILLSAPLSSNLEKIIERIGYIRTHSIFTKSLANNG